MRETIDVVALGAEFAERMPDQLSGGERQRVAVGRALIVEPRLLVCDEITSSLDVLVQALLVEHLRAPQRERGMTVLFITHNLALVRSIAREVLVLQHRRVIELGSADTILTAPKDFYTRRLLADLPRFAGDADPTGALVASSAAGRGRRPLRPHSTERRTWHMY